MVTINQRLSDNLEKSQFFYKNMLQYNQGNCPMQNNIKKGGFICT